MSASDLSFFSKKNRRGSAGRLKTLDTIKDRAKEDSSVISEQKTCYSIQNAIERRCEKLSALECKKSKSGHYGASSGNRRERNTSFLLDHTRTTGNIQSNGSSILQKMHVFYERREYDTEDCCYEDSVIGSINACSINNTSLSRGRYKKSDCRDVYRQTLPLRELYCSTFCKGYVYSSNEKEALVSARNTSDKKVHTDLSPFLCNVCMRHFKRLSSLKLHVFSHIHHVDIFDCPMIGCSKSFKDLPSTMHHIDLSHSAFKETLVVIAKDQRWAYNFKCFLALNDFYVLTKQEEKNVFRNAFCFNCFTFPISLEMHPCSRKYSEISVCPACGLAISQNTLKEHCFSSMCSRKAPVIKPAF